MSKSKRINNLKKRIAILCLLGIICMPIFNINKVFAEEDSREADGAGLNAAIGIMGGNKISDSVSYNVQASGMVTARCSASGEYSEHPTAYQDYNITCVPIYNPAQYLVFPVSKTFSGTPSSSGMISENAAFMVYKRECDEDGCWWASTYPMSLQLQMNVYDGATSMGDMGYGDWGTDYTNSGSTNDLKNDNLKDYNNPGIISPATNGDIRDGEDGGTTGSSGVLTDIINGSSNNNGGNNTGNYSDNDNLSNDSGNSNGNNDSSFDFSGDNNDFNNQSSDLNGSTDDLDNYFNNNSNGFDSSATDSLSSDLLGNDFNNAEGTNNSKYNSSDITTSDNSSDFNSSNETTNDNDETFDENGNLINNSYLTDGITYNDRYDNGLTNNTDANGMSYADFKNMFGLNGLDGLTGSLMDAMKGISNPSNNLNDNSLSSLFKNILGDKDGSINDVLKKTMTNQEMSDIAKKLLLQSGYSLEELQKGENYDKNSAYTEPKNSWDLNRITKLLKNKSIKLITENNDDNNKAITKATNKNISIK